MLLQQSIEHMSIVYTCKTYFVMHWFIQEFLVNVLIVLIQLLKCFNSLILLDFESGFRIESRVG